jgi:hypothetical protein
LPDDVDADKDAAETDEEPLADTLLRDGLRHVKDKTEDSLVEAERQFLTTSLEFLQV